MKILWIVQVLQLLFMFMNPIFTDSPTILTVLSDGAVATLYTEILGVYTRMANRSYNSQPVYRLDRGGSFLLYSDQGQWMIPSPVETTGGIITQHTGSSVPLTGWKYWDQDGGEWKLDQQLIISSKIFENLKTYGVCILISLAWWSHARWPKAEAKRRASVL